MLAALVVLVVACGRMDDGNAGSSNASDPAAMQTTTESVRESGGVLRDVVDDVERGVNNVIDGGTGNSGTAGNVGNTGNNGNTANNGNAGNVGNLGNGTSVTGEE